jgi:SAM-dependent methyltransferase
MLGRLVRDLIDCTTRSEPRSEWVLGRLGVGLKDDVLAIGLGGSGAAVRQASERASLGLVAGIDASETLLRRAAKRNADAIADARVQLRLGSACALPWSSGSFDKVFSIDAAPEWDDLRGGVREVHRVLRGGGLAAIAVAEDGPGWGERLRAAFADAGFVAARVETHDETACIIGLRA